MSFVWCKDSRAFIFTSDRYCEYCIAHGCHDCKETRDRYEIEKESRRQFLKEFVHWWRETHEHHCLTKDELWEKAGTREPITREDLGLPPGSQDGLESHPYW